MARILFVDDEADPNPSEFVPGNYMSYYELALSEAGYELTVARSEAEAMKKVQAVQLSRRDEQFFVVILDLHIQQEFRGSPLDPYDFVGVSFAEWAEKQEVPPRIVVLTNVTDPEVCHRLDGLSCVRFVLFKHLCTPNQLVDVVKRL